MSTTGTTTGAEPRGSAKLRKLAHALGAAKGDEAVAKLTLAHANEAVWKKATAAAHAEAGKAADALHKASGAVYAAENALGSAVIEALGKVITEKTR